MKKITTTLHESNSVRIVLFEKRDQNKSYFFYNEIEKTSLNVFKNKDKIFVTLQLKN